MPERRPRLLVGSSTEGLETARALAKLLEPDIDTELWSDGFFQPGEFALESLEIRARSFDGALVVGTADDHVISRGEETEAVRDNLLLEFGMFVAMFGRRKAILALEDLEKVKVPTDLFGLTCVGFKRTDPVTTGLAAAATEIARAVKDFAPEVVDPRLAGGMEAVLRAFLSDMQEALGVQAHMGFHVWVVDPRTEPHTLARVARLRTSPKAQLPQTFARGKGVVGECWRTFREVHVDFSEEPYRSATEVEWAPLGEGVKKGMDFELLDDSRARYRAVGAVPIVSTLGSGTEFLGCLSYNVGPNIDANDFKPDPGRLESALGKAGEVIRLLLEQNAYPLRS